MNISTRAKALVGAVAIGGAAIAMGGAFTAGGLDVAGVDADAKMVGGVGEVTVTGATLSDIAYDINSGVVEGVQLTFVDDLTDTNSVSVDLLDGADPAVSLYTAEDGQCTEDLSDTTGMTYNCDLTTDTISSSSVVKLAIDVSSTNNVTL
ncbi:hypothetical protein NHL50_00365 [Acidimicrobiia bacterium EGI L10123]|uniref:hypothetical protein n=1 Tax=Salinilacustrithrix flava TaxID=2957203 RepID=UPI003D7C2CA9|nr:hypothetical protein [Acidimicrobiia bacterium EGI L10123]